jgi:hypothetical protein
MLGGIVGARRRQVILWQLHLLSLLIIMSFSLNVRLFSLFHWQDCTHVMNGTTHPLVGYGELSRPSASLARRFQMRCLLIRICLIIQYLIRYETSLVRSTIIRESLPHVGKIPACALKSRNDSVDCHARSAPPTRLFFVVLSNLLRTTPADTS